jgi:hypothetical protein
MGTKIVVFRCKECGRLQSIGDEANRKSGVCQECAEWLETINASDGRVRYEQYYRDKYSGVRLDRCTLDWLRQNY